MGSKKHFVFDLDDTITNSYEFNQQMFVDTFLLYQPDVDQEFVRDIHFTSRGKPMEEQFTKVIKHFDLKLDPAKLRDENERMHTKNYQQITVFDAIVEMFAKLKHQGKKLSVCTNRQYDSLNAILKHNNLFQYFDDVVSCLDEGYEKPKPDCLLNIIAKHGGTKADYIYFGDSRTDYEFAKAAGIDFIIVDHYLNDKRFYQMLIESFM